jgi:hypothetical protein
MLGELRMIYRVTGVTGCEDAYLLGSTERYSLTQKTAFGSLFHDLECEWPL